MGQHTSIFVRNRLLNILPVTIKMYFFADNEKPSTLLTDVEGFFAFGPSIDLPKALTPKSDSCFSSGVETNDDTKVRYSN